MEYEFRYKWGDKVVVLDYDNVEWPGIVSSKRWLETMSFPPGKTNIELNLVEHYEIVMNTSTVDKPEFQYKQFDVSRLSKVNT